MKNVEEYLSMYNTDIESDLKSIVQSLSDNELSAIIGGSTGDEVSFTESGNEVPVRRNTHGF